MKILCSQEYECKGECWLNVACCSNDIWETIARKCNGTREEREMLGDMFNNKRDRSELFLKYNFTEEEKHLIIDNSWY